jgi:hypothetical protein
MARDKTALFAWELGEGLGHLGNLRLIAKALQAEGFKPVFALRDAITVREVPGLEEAQILAAPVWLHPVPPPRGRLSYADILLSHGFATPQDLTHVVKAWDDVFALTQPSLLICDHAPGAMFSAFGRIPSATVGNGFTVPPTDARDFPPIQAGADEQRSQAPLLETMKAVQARLGRREPRGVTEPFHGQFRGIYVFPEIDPYRRLRREVVLGPIEPQPAPRACPSKPHLFVYGVSTFDHSAKLVEALAGLSIEVSAYFRGRVGPSLDFLKSRGVTIHDTPPLMPSALPSATAVFSHGGTGLTQAALAAGRPQIIAPRFMEADLTAQAIADLKAGVRLAPFDANGFRKAVEQTVHDGTLRQNARAFAEKFAALKRANPLEVTLAALSAIAQ